ncbi:MULTISPECIES: hypothetical protein [Spirosoma]|uniref:Spy/CpxP family protein refolding chaperone n=2 Tax=Spirosoma TaxID=107 RepID=A0A6G9ASU2_9BACT|nr:MULTISPECIES: hypothetical protein [Spirosoma]QHV94877.1 hypothetical protein GJR95_07540 [Spirosoma endbachense]QIP15396.1 hypothetical protein G8759_23580 [Spirosoma aureum]
MKKVLMTAATLVVLLSTSALAQRYGYPSYPSPQPNGNYPQQPGYNQPGYGQPNYNYDYDDYRFDRHLEWWDRELNLSRRQEREIRRIRNRFEQQTNGIDARDPRQRDFFRQARQRQFFDMMAVLNPDQRNRVIDRMRPYERSASRGRGYGNDRDYYPRGY